jgi:hypothetical protein
MQFSERAPEPKTKYAITVPVAALRPLTLKELNTALKIGIQIVAQKSSPPTESHALGSQLSSPHPSPHFFFANIPGLLS